MPSRTTYWRCDSCWEFSEEGELLRAPNPFDAEADEIIGCPHCKEADDFTQACDLLVNGKICGKPVTSGTPTPNGGYVHRCLAHGPHRIGFSEAETTPVLALASGTRSAETRSKAPSEGCQSGPSGSEGNAQKVQHDD